MNYLTRPVFEFDVQWRDKPSKRHEYDLREVLIGFGAEFFTSLQSHVAQGWEFSLLLDTPDKIEAYEDFTDALIGRLTGFWLPTPFNALRVVGAVNGTHFDVADTNLRDTWEDHPDIYLWVKGQPCKVTAVVLQGAGIERVTVQETLNPQPAAGDRVQRLHYVRLAGDVESGAFLAENKTATTLKVIELPTEYAAFETGERPIYLYHFSTGVPMDWHWRYTSFAADVVSGNELFSAFPITHGTIKDSIKLEDRTLDVNARYDAAHPFAFFLPIPFSRSLYLEIFRCTYGAPDTAVSVFSGQVRTVSDKGESVTAECDDFLSILRRKFPRMQVQPECNYQVYEPRTCKALRAFFETSGVILSDGSGSRPPNYYLTLDFPDHPRFANWRTLDWFTGGILEVGCDLTFEVRTILRSGQAEGAQDIYVFLNAPLLHHHIGDRVQIIPGCDGLASTCRNKFRNFDNFGGFVAVPEKNLSLQAIDAPVSQGSKK